MAAIELVESIRFRGVLDDKNISGISIWKGRALVVTDEAAKDEGNVVQMFDIVGAEYRVVPNGLVMLDVVPGQKKPPEMDLEGVAIDGDTVYVLGSHSWRRQKVDEENSYTENRKALAQPAEAQSSRDVLLKFQFNSSGEAEKVKRTSLRPLLRKEPFKSFSKIASKENGIDAEGLAFFDGHLYVGFRGPVLRGNFVPVLKVLFGKPIRKHELLFVNLGGRGIRDLAHTDDGLLILAGPVGDGPGSYQIYHWDGRDAVPGSGAPSFPSQSGLQLVDDLPLPKLKKGSSKVPKAEGLALEKESSHSWEILVVFDGIKGGVATRYRIKRPRTT